MAQVRRAAGQCGQCGSIGADQRGCTDALPAGLGGGENRARTPAELERWRHTKRRAFDRDSGNRRPGRASEWFAVRGGGAATVDRMNRTRPAISALLALLLMVPMFPASANPNNVDVILTAANEPPPLRAQPSQDRVSHHISPLRCTVLVANGVEVCAESGAVWECPAGLSARAVHDGTPPTYNEAIGVPLADRPTHCLFVRPELAYPLRLSVVPWDRSRTTLDCVDVHGVYVEACQTTGRQPAPPVVATPVPTAAPTAAPNPPIVAVPVPGFTG